VDTRADLDAVEQKTKYLLPLPGIIAIPTELKIVQAVRAVGYFL
jgi:hypothetical protein